jgi:hypothetical protein
MTVIVLDSAAEDIIRGRDFYESREQGVGDYFEQSIVSDLHALAGYAGVHSIHFGFHRMLSNRFPFAIYYEVQNDHAIVHAILDMRRDPSWIHEELGKRS